jgi:N-acetyl-anhydromuramyl-L-alanine amidase AmpD
MTIKQNLVPSTKYSLKCPYAMTPVGLCVHNTANDASAKNEISYMVTNANQTSFHFAVDDVEVWQGLPLDRNGWHAGDGASGAGNTKHIGIEICYSKSGGDRFNKAEDRAVDLIVYLLKDRKWGIEQVKKHQDFSGKYCPHRTLDLGWDRFINKIKNKLGATMVKNNVYYKQADVHARYEVASLDELDAKIGGYKSRISDLTKQLGIAQAEVKNKEEIIGRLQDNYKALEDDKNILMDRLEQSQNTITQLGRDKGNLAIEVEQLRIQVETLKQGNQQGGITADSTLKQFVEWVKNLFWKN